MIARLLLSALILLVVGLPAPAQGTARIRADGSELFRFALHLKDLKPLATPLEAFQSPRSTIIVVVGKQTDLSMYFEIGRLQRFLMEGGAILLATDRPTTRYGWGNAFGFEITGNYLECAPQHGYRESGTRPFVRPVPVDGPLRRQSVGDLFGGVPDAGPDAIATDRPSELIVHGVPFGMITFPLAGYPPGTRRAGFGREVRAYFAVSLQPRQVGPGRMLVLADQGVFANGMMGFESAETEEGFRFNNGNWAFTNRTIDWLRAGPTQVRTNCLFIEDGNIIDQFAIPVPPTPKPPIPEIPPDVLANILLNHSNAVINDLQEKNFFNRMMEGFFGFPRVVRGFLIVATILLIFFGLRWLRRGLRKPEAKGLSPAAQAALLPRGGVLKQRTIAQIEVGNLYEAAARRVRDRFDVLGGRPTASGEMPPFLVASDLRDAPVLGQTVRWLWSIGYGGSPVPVVPTEWDRLNGLLERVTARAAHGDWSFGADAG